MRNSEPDKLPWPNRRIGHYVRGFRSELHFVASNKRKCPLRRKLRNEQRTRRSNEKIEPEYDKSASRFSPQDRIQVSFLRRNCIPKVACVALA